MLPYNGEQAVFHMKLLSFILKLRYTVVIVLVNVGAEVGVLTGRSLFL
jgi:hypothetical protein